MSAQPILFSGSMVRAILSGAKTQTRRLAKVTDSYCKRDRLWVRETFKKVCSGEVKNGYGELRYGVAYAADNTVIWRPHATIIHDLTEKPKSPTGPLQFRDIPWKPAIHMPRTACRLTLELIDVRVERLQEISEKDAIAEGVQYDDVERVYHVNGQHGPCNSARDAFACLWQSLNVKRAPWSSNPWVWVLCFKRIDQTLSVNTPRRGVRMTHDKSSALNRPEALERRERIATRHLPSLLLEQAE